MIGQSKRHSPPPKKKKIILQLTPPPALDKKIPRFGLLAFLMPWTPLSNTFDSFPPKKQSNHSIRYGTCKMFVQEKWKRLKFNFQLFFLLTRNSDNRQRSEKNAAGCVSRRCLCVFAGGGMYREEGWMSWKNATPHFP